MELQRGVVKNPAVPAAGFPGSNLREVTNPTIIPTCHEALLLSSLACPKRMAVHSQVVLRRLICRHSLCQAPFYICSQCYRGHGYCSSYCRTQARREQLHRAKRKYRQTPEGRQDHCDHQHAYRTRLTKARVGYHSSPAPRSPALCRYENFTPSFSPHCIRCGRTGCIA